MLLSIDASAVLAALIRAPIEVTKAVDESLGQGALAIKRAAVRIAAPHSATGLLIDHIRVKKAAPLVWTVNSSATANGRPYAVYVEEGIRGGRQQLSDEGLAAIAMWIKRKGITPRMGDRSLRGPRRQLVDSTRELAWLIGAKIARRGLRPQPYMQPAFEQQRAKVIAMVVAGAERGLKAAGLAA